MICFLQNNRVKVVSFKAPRKELPNLKEDVAVGTMVLYSSYTSGRLYCSFRRKLAVPTENSNYTLDLSQNQYAIWASGDVNNGIPVFHSQYFGASPDTIDIAVSLYGIKILSNMGFSIWGIIYCLYNIYRMFINLIYAECYLLTFYLDEGNKYAHNHQATH